MKSASSKNSSGFTLVELLVGVTLAAGLMAAVLSSYLYLARGLARLANQQILETEARRAVGYFTQDVQTATGISGTPTVSSVTLQVPGNSGTTTISYAYNSSTSTLTRTTASGTEQVLTRNITVGSFAIRYFDGSGTATDDGNAPYTAVMTYSTSGIKQLTLQFNTQLGSTTNGTRTQLHRIVTGRLVLRNKSYLP